MKSGAHYTCRAAIRGVMNPHDKKRKDNIYEATDQRSCNHQDLRGCSYVFHDKE